MSEYSLTIILAFVCISLCIALIFIAQSRAYWKRSYETLRNEMLRVQSQPSANIPLDKYIDTHG